MSEENCPFCRTDSEGYIEPLDRNGHVYVMFVMFGWVLRVNVKGWKRDIMISYCPVCGRRLEHG